MSIGLTLLVVLLSGSAGVFLALLKIAYDIIEYYFDI